MAPIHTVVKLLSTLTTEFGIESASAFSTIITANHSPPAHPRLTACETASTVPVKKVHDAASFSSSSIEFSNGAVVAVNVADLITRNKQSRRLVSWRQLVVRSNPVLPSGIQDVSVRALDSQGSHDGDLDSGSCLKNDDNFLGQLGCMHWTGMVTFVLLVYAVGSGILLIWLWGNGCVDSTLAWTVCTS